MKIPEKGLLNGPHYLKNQNTAAAKRPGRTTANPSADSQPSVETQATGHLKNLAAASSDVRENLVQEIRLKLQTGEYLKQQAAYDAAESILNL
ncbi:MAG: hypothetical protein AAF456_07835 [Planctomycetota bacterium]